MKVDLRRGSTADFLLFPRYGRGGSTADELVYPRYGRGGSTAEGLTFPRYGRGGSTAEELAFPCREPWAAPVVGVPDSQGVRVVAGRLVSAARGHRAAAAWWKAGRIFKMAGLSRVGWTRLVRRTAISGPRRSGGVGSIHTLVPV